MATSMGTSFATPLFFSELDLDIRDVQQDDLRLEVDFLQDTLDVYKARLIAVNQKAAKLEVELKKYKLEVEHLAAQLEREREIAKWSNL